MGSNRERKTAGHLLTLMYNMELTRSEKILKKLGIPKVTKELNTLYHNDICKFFEEQYVIELPTGLVAKFPMEPWIGKMLKEIFHTYDENGHRLYTKAVIGIPRKNYKTQIAAGIGIWGTWLDLLRAASVICVAGSRDQAGKVFKASNIGISHNPNLSSLFKTPTVKVRFTTPITIPSRNAEYRVVASDAGLQMGENPSLCIFDELHVQKNSLSWNAFRTAMGARFTNPDAQNPMLLTITTAGYDLYENDGHTKAPAYDEFCKGISILHKRKILAKNDFHIDPIDRPHFKDEEMTLFEKYREGNQAAEKWLKDEVVATRRNYFFWSYKNVASNYIENPEFLNTQRRELTPREFQIFHENRWVGGSGSLLTEKLIYSVFDRKDLSQQEFGDPEITYYMGIDMGSVRDRTVVAVVHLDANTDQIIVDNLRIWENTKEQPCPIKQVRNWVVQKATDFNIDHLCGQIVFDPKDFMESSQALADEFPMEKWSASMKGVQEVSKTIFTLCRNQRLKCFENEMFRAELIGLQEVHKSYGFKIDHSKNSFNDITSAIGMAANAAIEEGGEFAKTELMENKDTMVIHLECQDNIADYN